MKRQVVVALAEGLVKCPHCGLYFRQRRRDQVFCSPSCGAAERAKRAAALENNAERKNRKAKTS